MEYRDPRDEIALENLAQALREAVQPEVMMRAREMASRMELNGARIAAEQLTQELG